MAGTGEHVLGGGSGDSARGREESLRWAVVARYRPLFVRLSEDLAGTWGERLGLTQDDLVQLAAEKAYAILPGYDPSKGSLATFLWVPVRNHLLDELRSAERRWGSEEGRGDAETLDDGGAALPDASGSLCEYTLEEIAVTLEGILSELEMAVFARRYLLADERRSRAVVARELAISSQQVREAESRAIGKIQHPCSRATHLVDVEE